MRFSQQKTSNITKVYLKFGFKKSQINGVIENTRSNFNNLNETENLLANYYRYMVNLGYDNEQACLLATRYPNIIFYDFSNESLPSLCIEYLESNTKEKLNPNCLNVREILEDLKISKEKIDKVFNDDAKIISQEPHVILNNIRFYLNCGMSINQLAFCANRVLDFLILGEEYYSGLFAELKEFGIEKKGFVSILIKFADKHKTICVPDFLAFLRVAKSKKVNYIKFGKSLVKCIMIDDCTEENFEKTYENLIELNFSEEQARNIISTDLTILSLSKETLEYRKLILESYVDTEEEALTVINEWPNYLSLGNENIINKLDVIFRYGILWFILKHPKNLIQGSELIEDRALYLRLYYPELDDKEYASDIFACESRFLKKYNKSNEEIKKLLNNKM